MSDNQDEKITASSYIISFYREIDQLTTQYSIHHNVVLEIKQYKDLDQGRKDILTQSTQAVRLCIIKTFIRFESMKEYLKVDEKTFNNIELLHQKINSEFIIKLEDCKAFVLEMNKILLTKIIKSLLTTSQEVLNGVYGKTE